MSQLQLKTLIEALITRNRFDEASFYSLIVPMELYIKHGISDEKVMEMTIDSITQLLSYPDKPDRYNGWNFWWGEHAINSVQEESHNA